MAIPIAKAWTMAEEELMEDKSATATPPLTPDEKEADGESRIDLSAAKNGENGVLARETRQSEVFGGGQETSREALKTEAITTETLTTGTTMTGTTMTGETKLSRPEIKATRDPEKGWADSDEKIPKEKANAESDTPRASLKAAEIEPAEEKKKGLKPEPFLKVDKLSFWFGDNKVLKEVDLPVWENAITSLIGPSGCGKTTLLRCFNRMHDLYHGNRYEGKIVMEGRNLLDKGEDLIWLRSRLGMVFQKPTPFPMSVYDNIAYGLKLNKITNRPMVRDMVEKALRQANLWDEVKDRLKESALGLSGGQQQRLSIARSLAVSPTVLLFDEATSALDPISSAKIEEMMTELKKEVTIVVVTHNMQQAARISDYTALMWLGTLVEYGETADIFTRPKKKMTERYVAGNFG
jgi:phosphate transport system ATP-binding protein